MQVQWVPTLLAVAVQLLAMIVVVPRVNRRLDLGGVRAEGRSSTALVRGTLRLLTLAAAAVATFVAIIALRMLTLWLSR